MCGRFYVEPEDPYFRELEKRVESSPLAGRFPGKTPAAADGSFGGEVFPENVVPVLAPNRAGEQSVFPMQWGFVLPASGGGKRPPRMINARSETAGLKPLFRESWAQRRCVIPATAYFEWEHRPDSAGRPRAGRKYRIRPKDGSRAYLAGLYRMEAGLPSFVVLTRAPAEDLSWMHDRMPVLLPEAAIGAWLSRTENPEEILRAAVTETEWKEESKPV